MRKNHQFIFAVGLFLVSIFACLVAEAWREPKLPTQGGTPVMVNFGCIDIATPTWTFNATQPIDFSDILPGTVSGWKFRVISGEVIFTHGNMIATGSFADRVGELIASGSTVKWDGIGGVFVGKIMANSGTAKVTFDLAW